MSEIKITLDSLENAILKDGQFVSGWVIGSDSSITSNSSGAFAGGYVYDSEIGAYSFGAFANGCAVNNSSIIASGYGAHAEGYTYNNGSIINASGNGAVAMGCAHKIQSSYMGNISADSSGSIAMGHAIDGYIKSEGYGSIAMGCAQNPGAKIVANGTGAIAMGCAYGNNNDVSILKADGNGAAAIGFGVQAKGPGAFACGYGTIADSSYMTAVGKFNVSDNTENTLFAVGNGNSDAYRSNAFRVNNETNSVPSSVQAKVNGVPDVYLGCPIGTIVMWAGLEAPDGWLLCDGSTLSIADEYHNLYIVIGSNYGGNGLTTFNLPNLQQKFPIGAEIGGVGNKINKGSLILSYSNNNREYQVNEGNLEIGQFLDLRHAAGLDTTSLYTSYCVIVDFIKSGGILSNDHIYVNKCNEFGKITDKTTEDLFDYFNYTSTTTSISVHDISIFLNEYSTILGSTGGEETHRLTPSEITTAMVSGSGSGAVYRSSNNNDPHNNIPPYLAINFIIKYK